MSVFFASILPVMLLAIGLAIDVGALQLNKIRMQTAADAAVIGAELVYETGASNWLAQGIADASVNGYTNGVNNVSVTVTQKATSGQYNGYYNAIQLTISQPVKLTFLHALNGGSVTISATAVALVPTCAFYMNKSLGLVAYDIEDSQITTNCPVYINQGMHVLSDATANATAFLVAGSAAQSSNSGVVTPAPMYNSTTATDPLASITQPSFSGCTYTNKTWPSGSTLSPGTYCNSFNFQQAQITLNPGLYIITGGATWNQVTVNGTGVTLFFTSGGGFGYGQFYTSQAAMNLSAPSSNSGGALAGILIFGDRHWTLTNVLSGYDFLCTGGTFTGDGIWYTTTTGLYFNSCPISAPNYANMVTDHLYLYGVTETLGGNFSNVSGGNPFRTQLVLVQ
jgi:hypothetical protein